MLDSPYGVGIKLMPLTNWVSDVPSSRSNMILAVFWKVTSATRSRWRAMKRDDDSTMFVRNDLMSCKLTTPRGWFSSILPDVSTTNAISSPQKPARSHLIHLLTLILRFYSICTLLRVRVKSPQTFSWNNDECVLFLLIAGAWESTTASSKKVISITIDNCK